MQLIYWRCTFSDRSALVIGDTAEACNENSKLQKPARAMHNFNELKVI